MSDIKNKIEIFFNEYAAMFNRSLNGDVDVESTTRCFASGFIEAGPSGVVCGQNDERFREVIPKGYEYYRSIGTISMEVLSKEIALLDSMHAMARIKWKSKYRKKDASDIEITFEVIYLLQILNSECKIFGYITGDEQKVLKEQGIIK